RKLLPRVDIIEHDTDVVLRAQIPGVDKKDLNVTMTDNMVTIEGSTSHEASDEEGDYFRRECTHGSFMRRVALPSDVDGAKAKAVFSDGILELTMPKLARTTRHTVDIA
ncbi:MAG TPA: Hsp20/alpha crystallin family protein, partial [Hyphomicrobiales bacterium]|nr:Hsp20/alpha crystallin family protein [Hyphomicrobiales bacterium]